MSKNIYNLSITAGILITLLNFSCNNEKSTSKIKNIQGNNFYINLSVKLIEGVKENEDVKWIREKLEAVDPDTLAQNLISDEQKKAFWINIYNAHIQIFLSENKELFEDRGSFFSSKRMIIAQNKLSFDDIEHGIIRSSKFKLALGLIKNPFAGKFEKKFRTNKTDGRVHFALNCGAKSCPLVATYDADHFNQKIDQVAKSFLQKMSAYDNSKNEVSTTTLFSWFRGDFDGKDGILKYLKKYEVIPKDVKPSINYLSYDWTLSLGNYYEE